MRFSRVFWVFFWLSALLALLHGVAIEFYIYWTFLWFDIPVHFLGGLVVALGLHSVVLHAPRVPAAFRYLLPTLGFVLIVGLLWEAYELMIDIPITDEYAVDTSIDLLMDLLGGAFGYTLSRMLSKEM